MSIMTPGGKPQRKAATSGRAKKVVAVATAESKEAEDGNPPRKRGRPRKNKDPKNTGNDKEPGTEGKAEESGEETESAGVDIDWNGDTALTLTLISAIEDDENTRGSLFPPPGSTKRTGGLPKKHYHQLLAKICFANHDNYKDNFAKAVKPKHKAVWTGKIKNRIKVLTDKTRAQIEMMGQTGAGLESAEDILPGTVLMTKWDEIQEESPWFWRVRSLIGERPNLMPVGIGNNSSDMDVSILLPGNNDNGPADGSLPTLDDTTFPESIAGTDSEPLISRVQTTGVFSHFASLYL
ncbi:hypothetical protein DFH09DRAFT_1328809 [Mycena vulgaris]|nr:hypothetical protein DFH09DRAFT_1328809 [Mycena vulgaris]